MFTNFNVYKFREAYCHVWAAVSTDRNEKRTQWEL